MAESGGLSWEAQEVFQKIKSFGRLPGSGVPMIQLNTRVGSAKTVKPKILPDEPRTGMNFCAFPAFWQDRRVARTNCRHLGQFERRLRG